VTITCRRDARYVAAWYQWLRSYAREIMHIIERLNRGQATDGVKQNRWVCRTSVIKVRKCLVLKMHSWR